MMAFCLLELFLGIVMTVTEKGEEGVEELQTYFAPNHDIIFKSLLDSFSSCKRSYKSPSRILPSSPSQLRKHRLLLRPNIQLLCPRTPRLRIQIPINARQIRRLHNKPIRLRQLLLLALPLPLPPRHAPNQLPIHRPINNQMRTVNPLTLILARDNLR